MIYMANCIQQFVTAQPIIMIILATILAIPLSLGFIYMWVRNFAYRADINVHIFFVTAAAALIIAFLTAGYHCIRVARSNPVDALRYE